MTKTYRLEGLDCAVCAAKMEAGIKKIKGVENASVSFLTEKLVLTAADEGFDAILKEVIKVCRKIEPECEIIAK